MSSKDAPSPDVAGLIEAEKKGIYIASKTKHAHRWRVLRDKIGYPITSTWIDEAGDGESKDLSDLWRRCIAEASSAEVVVVYREPGDTLKGAWIELGAALASGVPVFAVGIEEFTVAHDKRIRHFNSMAEAVKVLKPMVNGTRFAALSRLTPPKQDDAQDLPVKPVAWRSWSDEQKAWVVVPLFPLDGDPNGIYEPLYTASALASARADGAREGLERAEKWVDRRLRDYVDEHGAFDPETGVTEFPGNGDEYVAEVEEIADAIRALINKDAGGNRG